MLAIIIAIYLTIVCGGFSAAVAGSKSRSKFDWFLLGAVFWIFALIAVVGMPAIETEKE